MAAPQGAATAGAARPAGIMKSLLWQIERSNHEGAAVWSATTKCDRLESRQRTLRSRPMPHDGQPQPILRTAPSGLIYLSQAVPSPAPPSMPLCLPDLERSTAGAAHGSARQPTLSTVTAKALLHGRTAPLSRITCTPSHHGPHAQLELLPRSLGCLALSCGRLSGMAAAAAQVFAAKIRELSK
jgi:hypothetical protein